MEEATKTERLVEIFSLLDLGFCAQASMSFNKSSMRDTRVLLSETSGPAVSRMRGRVGVQMDMLTANYPPQYRIDV